MVKYFKTEFGTNFDKALSYRLLVDCGARNNKIIPCRAACKECDFRENDNCGDTVVKFMEENKTSDLIAQACSCGYGFGITKEGKIEECNDIVGCRSCCSDCLFYATEIDNCRINRAAWLKERINIDE